MKLRSTGIILSPEWARVLVPVLYVIFLFAGAVGNVSVVAAQDDVSFDTPEEAITFYIQSVAEGEVSELMQATAVDEMSENFRFDLYVQRLRALNLQSPAPSDDTFYAEINKAQFSSQVLFQTRNLTYGLLTSESQLIDGQMIVLPEDEAADFVTGFVNEVDPERLAQLQVITIAVPSPELAQSERNVENWDRLARVYGADELTERVALLLFEGDYYYVGFTLLRYEDDWKISSVNSALGNTSSLGAPVQITEEEFEEAFGGN